MCSEFLQDLKKHEFLKTSSKVKSKVQTATRTMNTLEPVLPSQHLVLPLQPRDHT